MSGGGDRGADRFDLVVIGAGPAGEKGATQAAYHGYRVAVVEEAGAPGGTAVATGGIPTKALRETALQVSALRRGAAAGSTPSWTPGPCSTGSAAGPAASAW